MRILVFDTETTGLPKDYNVIASALPNNWPHIVSISWAILDSDTGSIMRAFSYIIKPMGWIVPKESTDIHGITQRQAEEYGVSLKDVLNKFLSEECDILVAHNAYFDKNVVMNAMVWDLSIPFNGFLKPCKCSMLASKFMCKIPNYNKFGDFKYPKLKELYLYVMKDVPKTHQLHSSLYDTLFLCEVIQKSKELRMRLGITEVENNNESQVHKPKTNQSSTS